MENHTSVETKARSRFFVVRHAESEANVKGLIVSDPETGMTSYGLTSHGRQQVLEVACQRLLAHIGETQSHLLSDNLVVVSSDFKRALETATIIHEHFKVKAPLCLERNLRERDFGQLNLTNASNYHKVWRHDALNPTHTEFGCETVMSVLSRTTTLLEKLKKEFQFEEKIVLLVSHGDTLQITLTAYAGVAPEYHRTLSSLGNCDVRELVEPDS